jgi:PAS domain S-box
VVAAAVAVAFGLAVLAGYSFPLGGLLPLPRFVLPTQPLAAVMCVLTGTSLLALQLDFGRLQRYTAIFVTLLAASVLLEYVLGVDLGVDLLIYPGTSLGMSRVFPGRPAPITVATFVLLGAALVIAALRPGERPRRVQTGIVLAAVVLPIVPIVGHLLRVPELHTFALQIGTALHTALVLLLLGLGVATATHETAVVALVRGRDPGTTLLRLLLPLAVLLPLFFAAGSVVALHLGLYEIHVGLVVFVSGCIAMFLGFAFWIVDMVRRADAERRAADRAQAELAIQDHRLRAETAAAVAARDSERRTRELLNILSHAPVMARGLDGRIRFWSAGAVRLYGWTAEQATGALARTLLPTAFPVLEREAEATLLEHGEWQAELSRRARDGRVVQVASHWILHRDEIGRPDAVIEVDKDVTDQRVAQDAFQRGEARYRALVAATARVVWTTSADGKRPIELDQWLAFTGQTALEADWGGWLRAIHPDDLGEAGRIWEESVGSGSRC